MTKDARRNERRDKLKEMSTISEEAKRRSLARRAQPAPAEPIRDPKTEIYFTERELADRWRIRVKTLQNRRVTGGLLPFFKFGSAVRYALSDIEAFEAAARRASTSDEGGEDA